MKTNADRAGTSTVEARSASRPVSWLRKLGDVPRPYLHHSASLVFVPKLRLQRWRRSVRVHFRLYFGSGIWAENARARLHIRNNADFEAGMANLYRSHFAVHFGAVENDVIFDYKIRDGLGKKLYGIEIAELMGLDKKTCDLAYLLRNKMEI